MVNNQLVNPRSIVVVGGSNTVQKPGGKVLKNLIDHQFKGQLYVVNPKETEVQGIRAFADVNQLPQVDLAILAIPAKLCPETVDILAHQKETRAFIILSAGFSEESHEGAEIEKQIVKTINEVNGSLIGPNCIGVLNYNYAGVFTTPIPKLDPKGCDFISGSGATAVFIMEAGMPKGLTFSSVYSVGNSAQMGVEEVLEYMDTNFDPQTSSKVKLLYIENIKKPEKLLKHASSLVRKGCKIAAIKSGSSEAGSRAASSHTGAMASPDVAVDALFKKAGIVRCYGRDELTTVASIFMHKPLEGKRIAIITHAGGPAVMLTDALSQGGFEIPKIEGPKAQELLTHLFPGSSVANPIDFLATGTAEQLGKIIDYCENEFENVDAMVVIFGSPGLFPVYDVYNVLDEKMKVCKKPIYPVLPSIINVADEIKEFLSKGRLNFPDEVVFAKALAQIHNTPKPIQLRDNQYILNKERLSSILANVDNGYLKPAEVQMLLDAAGIPRAGEMVASNVIDAVKAADELGYPVVMKVIGPVHKSDVGGVALNIKSKDAVVKEFERMIKIKDVTGILIQPMLSGMELFIGAKREEPFGHLVMFGMGGIFIEVLKDVQTLLVPVAKDEVLNALPKLKTYSMLKGVRGQEGVNIELFVDIICKVSALLAAVPEIYEMDINPLLGKKNQVIAVDARIRIEK
ncbi:MAG TPA: acetate--CoA ligase family protein [Bacteroidales bacterium]|nr:acetate--CoA ligase family protein [Bacteroidales bacterium]